MKRFFIFFLFLISFLPAIAQQSPKPVKTVYIRAGRLFDGTGDSDWVITLADLAE